MISQRLLQGTSYIWNNISAGQTSLLQVLYKVLGVVTQISKLKGVAEMTDKAN